MMSLFFFFKQKTAYEMRISDWSSDVCSSDLNPDLVRTMSVKPPTGAGRVRMIRIGDAVDYQPCGGTHLKSLGEIGRVAITKIENKGKQNRRINLALVD